MKKIIFLSIAVFTVLWVKAGVSGRPVFATSIGTGIASDGSAPAPVVWQMAGRYSIGKRFSAGIGTGLSFYEELLIPLFADVKFTLIRPRRFTPYLACSAGYGFAPGQDANGGFYFNPSAGVQYSIGGRKGIFMAVGYELQKTEQLKRYEHPLFTAEFRERSNYNFISIKFGLVF